MSDCIFCKIANKEIPCYNIFENNEFLAFLDIRPLNPGHCLVIPKQHCRWVWDVDNIGKYYEVVKKVANALQKAFDTDWVVSLVLGEEVHHAHVWLIPRFPDDGHGASIDIRNVKEFSSEQMKEFAEKVRENL